MNTYSKMLKSVLDHSQDRKEVMELFEAFKKNGIGLNPGFVEERMDHDLEYGSLEHKMLRKIILKSYKFHELDENLQYINTENENI